MATYTTVNGQQTEQTMLSQLKANGYGGPTDPASIVQAYANATKSPVSPMTSNQPFNSTSTVGGTSTGGSGGGTGANIPAAQLLLNQAQNAATAAYQQSLAQNASDTLAFDKAKEAFAETISQADLTGMFNGQPTLAAGQALGTINGQPTLASQEALGSINGQPTLANIGQQNQLAENFLNTLGGLQGPANAFKYAQVLQSTPNGLRDIVDAAAGRFRMSGFGGGAMLSPDNMQPANLNTLVGAAIGSPTGTANVMPGATGGASVGGTGTAGGVAGPAGAASAPTAASPLVQSASASGPLNRFGTTGPAPGATQTSVAPGQSGPTTPENRSFGIGAASQDFGNGPGQGGVDVSGQRGLSQPVTTGWNIGDALHLNFAALTGKAPGSFIQLQDKNTGRVVGQAQVQGTNQPVTITLLEPIDPSHMLHIFTDYPSEGGATAGIDFSPSQIAVDNSPQGQAARQAVVDFWHSAAGNVDNRAYAGNDVFDRTLAAQPAAVGAVRAAGVPSGSGYFVGTDGRIHVGSPSGTGQAGYGSSQGLMADPSWAPGTQVSDPNQLLKPAAPQASAPAAAAPATTPAPTDANGISSNPAVIPDFGALPLPNQIDPQNFAKMTPSQKSLLLGAYGYMGYDPKDIEATLNNSLPKFAAPTGATVKM